MISARALGQLLVDLGAKLDGLLAGLDLGLPPDRLGVAPRVREEAIALLSGR